MDIASMLEVQVKEETDVKENVTPDKGQTSSMTGAALAPISQEESNYYKLTFSNDIASVRFRRIHCTACDAHIGSAPAQAHNMFEHPILRTLLCSNCREFYGDGSFEQGDDATDMFCRWCANGGNLYCCSYCSNTFCYRCIRRNFTSLVRKKIEADEKWRCFVCNPSDLYSARAMCWALLQHVQTVTRILTHDKKMSAQEIEERMNLDESPCCPRRSKRKRRRLESVSEEEDETYSPKANGVLELRPRKQLKKHKPATSNGIVVKEIQFYKPIPIRPRPATFLSSGQSSIAEPTKSQPVAVSHENSIVNSKNIVLPPRVVKSNASLPSRFDPNALQQQSSLYHNPFMSISGSSTYIQTPVTVNPTRIILPPQPQSQPQLTSYQSRKASSYQSSQPLQSSLNTMVSIPNPVDKHGRPVFLFPKPKEVDVMLTPNIIELDSSDDEIDTIQQNNSTINGSNSVAADISSRVVPVALTWGNNDDDIREEPLREIRTTVEKDVSFNEMMLPHSQELDKFLSDTKKKMYNLFDLNNAIENIEVEAQRRINYFYHNMSDTVIQLVHLNDRIVRQYIEWRRTRKTETAEGSFSTNENTLVSKKNADISLDMTCVNDSDTESECNTQEYQIMKPSNLVKDSNIIKDLLFSKANVVHRGVGDGSVHSMDKAIQVYDTVSRDYEKCISYSVFRKPNQDPKVNDSVSNLPAESDKNFGKYEEQFISYLQHIEKNGIETENMKEANSDDMSLQEIIQTDPSFISHLFPNIDLPIVSTDQSENCQEKNLSDSINLVTEDDKNNTLDKKNKENANSATNVQETDMQLDDKLQQTESQKSHADTTDEEMISDHNKVNSNKNDNIINVEVASARNKEDCTMIDN